MNFSADETVLALGEALANDPAFPDDWATIVAVFKVQPGTIGSWAEYTDADGIIQDVWLEGDEIGIIAQRLHVLTQVENKAPWVACRVTIEREGMKLNIQFEYNDEKKWDTPLPF
ncbi:hypothetical protein [Paracoccus onubensis]|uniref:DUF600 family protein n=1 Tax=Paracoccus onubensis TaxID=1675788 RepID=A0A418T006_9RHOB|nr:hypothetical protein [Paracoccus onubensis]RJE86542.1 hypothetical protein D3P04_07440 [Paracoccus onubensis]